MASKYLDNNGLAYFWSKIKSAFGSGVKYPVIKKHYDGVIAEANNDAKGHLYFASVMPSDYQKTWKVRYRMYVKIGGINTFQYTSYEVEFTGFQNTFTSYRTFNNIPSSSYRAIYYHLLYNAKEDGISNGYGHLLGARFQSAFNPATAANARSFDIEILEANNCTVTFFDSFLKYADVPGTGSTNYEARRTFDAVTNGQTISGDRNQTPTFLYHCNYILAKETIPAESLIVGDSLGYSKVSAGLTYDISYPIVWCTAKINAGTSNYGNMFLCHYDRNIATGAKAGFVSEKNKAIYLVVTINGHIATIDSEIITDTLPSSDDGKVYIMLGKLGDQSNGSNYFLLHPAHPMFVYKNGAVREYSGYSEYSGNATTVNGHTVATNVPSDAVFTDTTYESKTAASGGTDLSLVTTGEKYTWNNKANSNHTHNYAGSSSAGGAANDVSGSNGTANAYRHIWFSDSSSETKRNYDDDLKYNPSTNSIKIGGAYITFNSSDNSLDFTFD